MGVDWRAGLMRWKPYVDQDGRAYPLHHVHPIRYEIELPAKGGHPARTVQVHIGFGMHCFTRKRIADDADAQCYRDDREVRTFDLVRYELSKRLDAVARSLPQRHCAFAKDENYVTIDLAEMDGQPVRYGVFFNLKRWPEHGPDAILVVIQSAYPLDAGKPEPGAGRITFNVLVGHTLRGTRPKRP